MGNKNNDKFAGTTCTQWPAAAALLTTKIVGLFGRTLHKINAVNFFGPLVKIGLEILLKNIHYTTIEQGVKLFLPFS